MYRGFIFSVFHLGDANVLTGHDEFDESVLPAIESMIDLPGF